MEQVIYMITLESFAGSAAKLQACMTAAPYASLRHGSDNTHTLRDAISAQKQIPSIICDILLKPTIFLYQQSCTVLSSM